MTAATRAAIRLATAAMVVAMLFGLAGGPLPGAEAAGGSLWSVSITDFCGRATGSPESAALKVKITLRNTGETAVAGYLFAYTAGYNNPQPIGYHDLAVDAKASLDPGESVAFTAFATGVNLAGNFRVAAGIARTPEGLQAFDYDYTDVYAGPAELPAC